MSLLSIRIDALEDCALDPLRAFMAALIEGEPRLAETVTDGFEWLGHRVGWDPDRARLLTDWLHGASASDERLLSVSLVSSMPEWIVTRSFGALEDGDRVGLFDLLHEGDRATLAVVIAARGTLRGRVRRVVDPGDFARLTQLARSLSRHP